MNGKFKVTILIGIITTIFFTNDAQNQSSSNLVKKGISIDSVSNISIDKVIYFSKPIELEYYALTDTSYIPKWYQAHCVNYNLFFFKDSLDKAINYISKDFALSYSDIQKMYDDLLSKGSLAEKYKKYPDRRFWYFYCEIGVTNKSNNKKYVITYGFHSAKKINNLKFSNNIVEKNLKNEKVDSIRKNSNLFIMSRNIFLNENNTLKLVDPRKTFNELTLDENLDISPDLNIFKDMIYRRQRYFLSDESNEKRKFKTMEKNGKVFKEKTVSNKPE